MRKFSVCVKTTVLYEAFSNFSSFPERIWPPQKSNFSFIARFWWNLKNNILICLPIIIEIEIHELGPPYHPGAILPSLKFFICSVILMKFETKHFHMLTNNNWDKNLWLEALLPPGSFLPHPSSSSHPRRKSKILHLWCNFAENWNKTFAYVCQ